MQNEYLKKLPPDLNELISLVEHESGLEIKVVLDPNLNNSGPLGIGKLKIDIQVQSICLFAPSNGYFPNGAVRHEVLHVKRIYVDNNPRLALADDVNWNPPLEKSLVQLDNAIEHLIIVPIELEKHSERHIHWERVESIFWTENIPNSPIDLNCRINVYLHWAFLRHVIPHSKSFPAAISFMESHKLKTDADAFVDKLLSKITNKEEMVRLFFDYFYELPRKDSAMEYLNIITGVRQVKI